MVKIMRLLTNRIVVSINTFLIILFYSSLSLFTYAQTSNTSPTWDLSTLKSRTSVSTLPGSALDFTRVKDHTGNVSFGIPLLKIGDVSINLSYYNKDVSSKVRTENQFAPSGSVGMGWQLQYGSISGEISGSADTSDDRYFYNGPDGSFELIQGTDGVFRIPNYKPWKIQRIVSSGTIAGWIITKEDGTILRFGNYHRSGGEYNFSSIQDSSYATRFYLGLTGLVENPNSSSYSSMTLIPYQWDLSDVQDIAGNHTSLTYQPVLKSLSLGSNISSNKYTQESFLLKITDNKGTEAYFNLDTMSTSEYYRYPQTYEQNLFDSLYLSSVSIKGKGQLYRKISLKYQNGDILSHGITKRYLTGFTIQGVTGDTLPSYSFGYCGLNGEATGVNPGAMSYVIDPKGGKIQYTYKMQSLDSVSLSRTDTLNTMSYWTYIDEERTPANDGLCGKDFTVITKDSCGTDSDSIIVYRRESKGWEIDTTFPFHISYYTKVSNDYVVIENWLGTFLVRRVQSGWKTYNLTEALGSSCLPVGVGQNYFIMKYNGQLSTTDNGGQFIEKWNLAIINL
jgi:hypothetical protein